MSDASDADQPADDVPVCPECDAALQIELWILEPEDVALLHVCSHHGVAAISRPFR